MGERNERSMFLTPTNKNEVICTVHSCGNKTSADCKGITMSLIKNVIECISEPVNHICNLSFKHGDYPHKMKIAKVILYLNLVRNIYLPTTDRSHFSHSSLKY